MVDRSEDPSREFSAAPTRDLSSPPLSLLKVLHSDPTSMTLSPTTRPHSEQIMSPARWSSTSGASGWDGQFTLLLITHPSFSGLCLLDDVHGSFLQLPSRRRFRNASSAVNSTFFLLK